MTTPALIQVQIDLTQPTIRITRSHFGATLDDHYVVSGQGSNLPGRSRWVQTTAAQTDAQQAAVILAALLTS